MKNSSKLIILIAISLFLSTILVACGSTINAQLPINFYVEDELYASFVVGSDSTMTLPADPKKEGMTFDGWVLKDGTPFSLSTLLNQPIRSSMELNIYAKFVDPNETSNTTDSSPDSSNLFKREYIIPRSLSDNPTLGFSNTTYLYSGVILTEVYLGRILNVPLDNSDKTFAVSYNPDAGPLTKTITRTSATEDEISTLVNTTATQSTTTTAVTNWSVGGKITFGKEKSPVKLEIGGEYGETTSKITTDATTITQSYQTAAKVSSSISNSISVSFDKSSHKAGWYRYIVIANLEIYGIYAYDLKTSNAFYYTTACVTDVSEQLQHSETGDFSSEADTTLCFDKQTFEKLVADQQATQNKFRHTINFELSGGFGPTNLEYYYHAQPQKTLPIPQKPGYVFAGWFDKTTGAYHGTITINDNSNLNLVAHWSPENAFSQNSLFVSDRFAGKWGTEEIQGRLNTFTRNFSVPFELTNAVKDGLVGIKVEATFQVKVRGAGECYNQAFLTIMDQDYATDAKVTGKGKKVLWETFTGSWATSDASITESAKLTSSEYSIGAYYYLSTANNKKGVFKQARGECTSLKITYYNIT